MKTIFLAALLVIGIPAQADEGFFRWCKDKSLFLSQALESGATTISYEQEEIILQAAVEDTLLEPPKKAEKYFRHTLRAALRDTNLYGSDTERRVHTLRFYIHEAIYDLDSLYYYRNTADAGPYVMELISRGLTLGYRTPEALMELALLRRTAKRSLLWLPVSDYRRTRGYSCAQVILKTALKNVKNKELSVDSKISILRIALRRAQDRLIRPRDCR